MNILLSNLHRHYYHVVISWSIMDHDANIFANHVWLMNNWNITFSLRLIMLNEFNRSVSLENIGVAAATSKKSQFPHAFIRKSRKNEDAAPESPSRSSASCDDLTEQTSLPRYRSVISVRHNDETLQLLRRKRSFSLAALPVSSTEAARISSFRSEESGYESDATRNGSEASGHITVKQPTFSTYDWVQLYFIYTIEFNLISSEHSEFEWKNLKLIALICYWIPCNRTEFWTVWRTQFQLLEVG